MPIYEYEHDCEPSTARGKRFEVLQSMGDPPLACCPTCGQPCHRVFSTFATITSERARLSPRNLERHGFTQYKRAGDGYYEKTFGRGPTVIKGD
jgi:putative FmdB family regulatory protein